MSKKKQEPKVCDRSTKLAVIQVSPRKFTVCKISTTDSEVNINMRTRGAIGGLDQMILHVQGVTLTKPLDFEMASKVYCYCYVDEHPEMFPEQVGSDLPAYVAATLTQEGKRIFHLDDD